MGKVISSGEKLLRSGNAAATFSPAWHFRSCDRTLGRSSVDAGQHFLFIYSWLSFIATVTLASTTLATRGLLDAVKRIEGPLLAGNLDVARQKLAHIVGRETAELNQDKVPACQLGVFGRKHLRRHRRPLFYLFAGGRPAALAYKAINTLDSMIGYRTDKYFYLASSPRVWMT
jgi:cobalamin biosynthesis protein CobD/CbiB